MKQGSFKWLELYLNCPPWLENNLKYAGGMVVALRFGLAVGNGKKFERKKPWWQRLIEMSIVRWRKELRKYYQDSMVCGGC